MEQELYIQQMALVERPEEDYLLSLPALRPLFGGQALRFRKRVTFLVGENGAGKSTLLEALAVACGFNPEGGSRNFTFSTRATHSGLGGCVRLSRGPYRPRDGYFLRAESFYNVASSIDAMDAVPSLGPSLLKSYGGRSLHEQSHGESFLALVQNRFGGEGLYLLDEPESALSPMRQMTLLAQLHLLSREGSQFIVATHSPILMSLPDADVYVLDKRGVTLTPYRETEHYQLTRRFLDRPEQILRYLLED